MGSQSHSESFRPRRVSSGRVRYWVTRGQHQFRDRAGPTASSPQHAGSPMPQRGQPHAFEWIAFERARVVVPSCQTSSAQYRKSIGPVDKFCIMSIRITALQVSTRRAVQCAKCRQAAKPFPDRRVNQLNNARRCGSWRAFAEPETKDQVCDLAATVVRALLRLQADGGDLHR
jgi:hypothetical protein